MRKIIIEPGEQLEISVKEIFVDDKQELWARLKYEVDRTTRAEEAVKKAYKALKAEQLMSEPYSTHEIASATILYLEKTYPGLKDIKIPESCLLENWDEKLD